MNDDEWWDLDDGWGGFLGGLTQIFRILENDNGLNHELTRMMSHAESTEGTEGSSRKSLESWKVK